MLLKAFSLTFRLFKKHPVIFLPFLAFAVIESCALVALFLAPRFPVNLVVAPLIRTFWGERYLHYPSNFLLLPKISSLAKMTLYVIFGSVFLGTAVGFINEVFTGKKNPQIWTSFFAAAKKYVSLFAAILFVTLIFYYPVKFLNLAILKYFTSGHTKLLFLKSDVWLGPFSIVVNFSIGILLQAAFVYMIPLLIIGNEKLLPAIGKSVLLFKRLFFPTLVLVLLSSMIYIPVILLTYNSAYLIENVFPEIILWILFVGIAINSVVIDALMTVSTTLLFLLHREQRMKK